MAINFDAIARRADRECVYLLKGTYHDSGGSAKTVRWCGPSLKCGSGIVFREPDDSSGAPFFWEPRLSRLLIQHDSGPLKQRVQTISDLNLRVATSPDETLRAEATSGRWSNKSVEVWAVEVDTSQSRAVPTGNVRMIFSGLWDKILGADDKHLRVRATASILDHGTRWPVGRLPENTADAQALWSDAHGGGLSNPFPTSIDIPEYLQSKFVPLVFGSQVWREIYYFGQRTNDSVNFFVSPQLNCFVHEVWIVGTSDPGHGGGPPYVADVVGDYSGVIFSYENTDILKGPIGTSVQVSAAGGLHFLPINVVYDARAFAKVSGPDLGTIGISPFYTNGGTLREDADEVINDVFTDSQLLNLTNPFVTGSIAAFDADNPLLDAESWNLRCNVPLEDPEEGGSEAPLAVDVLGDLMRRLNADLVIRYDSSADEMRIAPYWRGPESGDTADHTFREFDLLSRAPRSISWERDPDGTYANKITIDEGDQFTDPDQANNVLSVTTTRFAEAEDSTEQGSTKYNGVVEITETIKFWQNHDDDAMDEAAGFLLDERSQDIIVVEVELGVRGMNVDMGDDVAFVMDGIPTAVGMVRTIEQRWDELSVALAVYQGIFY